MTNTGSWISVRRARLRPVAFILLVVVTLEACTSWALVNEPVATIFVQENTGSLRVTRANYATVELEQSRIAGDSLIGFRSGSRTQLAIALSDVRSVEVKRTDGAKTVLVLEVLLVGVAIIAAATGSSSPPPQPAPVQPTSSCPLVYTWDGTHWRLDSGTFGGAIMRALQRTDVDNLDYATPADGVLRLKVANELNETDYVDALRVIAVDHDPALSVAPDANGKLHTFGALHAPVAAHDFHGRDALARVDSLDGWAWRSMPAGRDSANMADVRDGLDLTFVRPANARHAHLVLDGNNTPWAAHLLGEFVSAHGSETQAWYDTLNSHPALAMAMGSQIAREAFLSASVLTGNTWTPQGMFWESGPEISKRQVLDLDLSQATGDTMHVRLASVPMFWNIDRVAIDYTADDAMTVTDLPLTSARDQRGDDVRSRIGAIDDVYYALQTGDAAELQYAVPDLAPGLARTFMLRSTGWYHINTPVTASPDVDMLRRITSSPFGLSRVAVGRLNDALSAVAGARR